MAVVAVVVIIGGVIAMAMAVIAVAMVITPGKGFKKNPKKSSPRRKGEIPLGLLTQKGIRIRVIKVSLDILPA